MYKNYEKLPHIDTTDVLNKKQMPKINNEETSKNLLDGKTNIYVVYFNFL